MKRYLFYASGLICILLCHALAYAEVSSEIIYHGKLKEFGNLVNGTRNVQFKIFNQASGGAQVGPSHSANVPVANGIFSYPINMNGIDLTSSDLWIETIVENKILFPREKLTSVAFALHARNAQGIQQAAGENIDFVVGKEKKASIGLDGTMSSLAGGTTYYMVPRGAIIMWSGMISAIPYGWQLCDGANGTPDLTDRFVMSVQNKKEDPGAMGGSNSLLVQTENLPSHAHLGATADETLSHSHVVTIGSAGTHVHDIQGGYKYIVDAGSPGEIVDGNNIHLENSRQPKWQATPAGPHTHGVSVSEDSSHHSHDFVTSSVGNNAPIDNRPAFYKLAFIMKL